MNLYFHTVKVIEQDGVTFELQRAVIGNVNPKFWILWKALNDTDRKHITIAKEPIDGRATWVCYRKKKKGLEEYGTFKMSYALRDTSKLLPYQPRCVAHLCNAIINNNVAIDGSDTGLGKTYTALAVCREFNLKPAIICKKAGIAGWKRGCKFMEVDPVFIVNWELAKNGRFPFAIRKQDQYSASWVFTWKMPPKTLLIFDEAHVANHEGSINYALYTGSKGITSLSLSATIADTPQRLKAYFHLFGIMDAGNFESWLKNNGYLFNVYSGKTESLSEIQDLKEVSKRLYPRYGYRLKYEDKDVKGYFPTAIFQTEVVSLSRTNEEKQNKLYTVMMERVANLKELGKNAEALVANLRYRQTAELLKAEVLVELANEFMYEGKSVCIFVNFRDTLYYLSKALNTRSLIYGDQDNDKINREEVLCEFQKGTCRIIICMVEAGGTSIDLHDTIGNHPRISLVCPTYTAITLKQVCGRTYRAGSKTTPVIKLVYAAGTIEEKVADSVNRKLANISALNDGDLMIEDFFGMQSEETK